MKNLQNYVITKERDGQGKGYFNVIRAFRFSDAKKDFHNLMLSDLYEQSDGTIKDECGNEVWGFTNDGKSFSDDVWTYELLTIKEAEKFNS